ncbi:MAG: hypothetical protein IJS50_01695 [Desulfovibrio sp.]|nr:hypothetical protein [Desulfovibrio sp.]
MRKYLVLALGLVCSLLLQACAGQGGAEMSNQVSSEQAKGADVFNPYRHEKLPTSRSLSKDGDSILSSMGGKAQSLQAEAKHRRHWKEEIYPVIFGSPSAPHEILVLLDFAAPASEKVWQEVLSCARSLNPRDVKIVVFGKSSELYGTDLLGLMIWIARERKGQAIPYLSYALKRWNEVKAEQKRQGRVKVFANEFDSTAKTSDYPIHYTYLSRLNPPVSEQDELALARYSYDAGNVNMYQATQISSYYGLGKLPKVIVDGEVLSSVSRKNIEAALQ